MSTPADYRWVSCSKDASWSAAQYRHLVVPGQLTTVCGCTASHPEVWRTNTTKLNCQTCMEKGKNIIEWQVNTMFGSEPKPADKPRARVVPVQKYYWECEHHGFQFKQGPFDDEASCQEAADTHNMVFHEDPETEEI